MKGGLRLYTAYAYVGGSPATVFPPKSPGGGRPPSGGPPLGGGPPMPPRGPGGGSGPPIVPNCDPALAILQVTFNIIAIDPNLETSFPGFLGPHIGTYQFPGFNGWQADWTAVGGVDDGTQYRAAATCIPGQGYSLDAGTLEAIFVARFQYSLTPFNCSPKGVNQILYYDFPGTTQKSCTLSIS